MGCHDWFTFDVASVASSWAQPCPSRLIALRSAAQHAPASLGSSLGTCADLGPAFLPGSHNTCGHLSSRTLNSQLDRRKFRSQISDNMDRWSSRGWKRQRRERVRREEVRGEINQKTEDQGARRGRTVTKHCVFQCFSKVLWLESERVEK